MKEGTDSQETLQFFRGFRLWKRLMSSTRSGGIEIPCESTMWPRNLIDDRPCTHLSLFRRRPVSFILWKRHLRSRIWSKFAIVAQCVFRSRRDHQLLRPLSNNTKASSQCVNCLIFIHTVTTALSDCLSEPLHMAVI